MGRTEVLLERQKQLTEMKAMLHLTFFSVHDKANININTQQISRSGRGANSCSPAETLRTTSLHHTDAHPSLTRPPLVVIRGENYQIKST